MLYYNHFIIVYIVYIQYIQYIKIKKLRRYSTQLFIYRILFVSLGALPCCAALAGLFIVFKNQCGRLTCAPRAVAKAPQDLRKVAYHASALLCLLAIHIVRQAPFYTRWTLRVYSIAVILKVYPATMNTVHVSAWPVVKIASPYFLGCFRVL